MENNQISRIDRYTCKFENPVMEEKYINHLWVNRSKVINFILTIFPIVFLFDSYDLYDRTGFSFNIFGPVIFALIALSFRFADDKVKSKYHGVFIGTIFASYHSFQMYIMFIVMKDANVTAFTPGDLVLFPFLGVAIFTLFPFNLIPSIAFFLFFAVTIAPVMFSLPGVTTAHIVFIFLTLVLLVYNKWRGEKNSRSDFAKTVSIDDTKNLMQKTLKRYFGDVLSDKMLSDDGALSGENKWVTLSFTDLSAYSTIIEHMSPKVAVEFLNEYFTAMHDVIEEHGGHILNYIGDCMMVVYGAPEEMDNHENQAIKCAMKMREKLVEMNSKWDESELSRYWSNHGIEKITARTGIHTGSIIAGNIGSERMLQYSAIGDVVNVASRLEQANKEFGTDIAFSKEIYTALTKDLNSEAKSQGAISLKGREGETQVYSI